MMLNVKKAELKGLLDDLQKDSKRGFIKERSFKGDVLTEIVNSVTNWLNDIWSVVYEHNAQYWHAHKCLMCVANTLQVVEHERTGLVLFCDFRLDVVY